MLVDKGQVSPGVLVRQPYNDADIGLSKVDALAVGTARSRRIAPCEPDDCVRGCPRRANIWWKSNATGITPRPRPSDYGV
jgi:hypothetical protein